MDVALDDTTLKVLDKNKGSGTTRGHLWCFWPSRSRTRLYERRRE